MPINLTDHLDGKGVIQLQNLLFQILASAPGSPAEGRFYYDSTLKSLLWWDGSAWINPRARANHTGTQLASTISDLAATVQAYRLNQFATPNANVDFGNFRLTGLAQAAADTDAAQWGQVKNLVNGLDLKGSVKAATNTNINIANPGTSTFDSVSYSNGDALLLFGQSTGSQNGPWVFNGSAAALTRPAWWTTANLALSGAGSFMIVEQGSRADSFAILTTDAAVTVDTTSVAFTFVQAGTSFTAGNGINIASNVISALAQASGGITVGGSGIALDTSIAVRKFTATIGNGSLTTIGVNHALGVPSPNVALREIATNEFWLPSWARVDDNNINLRFVTAPTNNQFQVVVTG